MQYITQCSMTSSWVFEGLWSDFSDTYQRRVVPIANFVFNENSEGNYLKKIAGSIALIVCSPFACLAYYCSDERVSNSRSIAVRGLTAEEVSIAEEIFPESWARLFNLMLLKNEFTFALRDALAPWKQEGECSPNNLPSENKKHLSDEQAIVMRKIQKNALEDIQRKTSRFSLFSIPGKEKIRVFCENKLAIFSSVQRGENLYTENDVNELDREVIMDEAEQDRTRLLSQIWSSIYCSN